MIGFYAAQMRPAGGGMPAVGGLWAEEGGYYVGQRVIGGVNYHIVLAPKAAEANRQWKVVATFTDAFSTSDGLANLATISSAGLADHPAAQYCAAYAGAGKSGWYLGAADEMNFVAVQLRNLPLFSSSGAQSFPSYNWTSTVPGVADRAIALSMYSSSQAFSTKTTDWGCRPIRRILAW